MTSPIYEIPKRLADLLKTIGPIHEDSAGDYCYVVRLVLREDNAPAGFIVEQRLAETGAPASAGQGLSFKVPARADSRSEATFVFVDSLAAALEYIGADGIRENLSFGACYSLVACNRSIRFPARR